MLNTSEKPMNESSNYLEEAQRAMGAESMVFGMIRNGLMRAIPTRRQVGIDGFLPLKGKHMIVCIQGGYKII